MKNIQFKIITPNGVTYDKQALFIQLPGKGQELGIEPDHSPTLAELSPGKVMVEIDEETQETFYIPNGFCYIRDNEVTVISDYIKQINDIDKQHTEKLKKEAELAVKNAKNDSEKEKAALTLKAAEEQLILIESN